MMTKIVRVLWSPIGWLMRVMAWVMFLPLGVYLSYRKGRDRRHRETLDAIRSN